LLDSVRACSLRQGQASARSLAIDGVSDTRDFDRRMGPWYGFCEALTPVLGAWILYAVRAAQVLFGLNCVVYGFAHFAYADFTASMVPTWLPSRLRFAYFTGLGHLAAGIGIIVGILPRLAATLEALMMSLFGFLVWVPSLLAQHPPEWATPPQNRWSEFVVTLLLAASAWIVAASVQNRAWGFASGLRV
jgi:uncharacterized membrane protein